MKIKVMIIFLSLVALDSFVSIKLAKTYEKTTSTEQSINKAHTL